jgi:hypothetical protein
MGNQFKSALERAIAADAATRPDLTDPPVRVAAKFKHCPNCNRLMQAKRHEAPSHFRKRRHCSKICGAIAANATKKMAIDEARA